MDIVLSRDSLNICDVKACAIINENRFNFSSSVQKTRHVHEGTIHSQTVAARATADTEHVINDLQAVDKHHEYVTDLHTAHTYAT